MSIQDLKGTLLSAALFGCVRTLHESRAQKTASGTPNLSTKRILLNILWQIRSHLKAEVADEVQVEFENLDCHRPSQLYLYIAKNAIHHLRKARKDDDVTKKKSCGIITRP